jgi:hypothetical protein
LPGRQRGVEGILRKLGHQEERGYPLGVDFSGCFSGVDIPFLLLTLLDYESG